MEKYNRVGIKQLIKKYPDIGKILLDDYKINCMVCKGNCDLKNVVEEENLSLQVPSNKLNSYVKSLK